MTPFNSKKRALHKIKHPIEFLNFVEWFALPNATVQAKSQRELAKKLGVGEDTLSEWKDREGFYELVDEYRKDWAKEKTTTIIKAFFERIVNDPSAPNVKLWFQLFQDWSEPKPVSKELYDLKMIPIFGGESVPKDEREDGTDS